MVSAQVQNGKFLGVFGHIAVVDSERESIREQAMESKVFGMDSIKWSQTFNIGENGVFK